MDLTINPRLHRTSFNLKKAIAYDRYRKEIEDKLSKRRLPKNCQKEENIYPLDNTVLIQIRFQWKYWKGWEHETTSDPEIPHRLRCNRWTMRSPEQQTNIGEIHGDSSWRHWTTGYTLPNCGELSRQYTANHRQNVRTKPSLLMTLIIFPNYFNRQFTTSKLGRHTSSRETRIGSREVKRKSLMSAVIGFCDNSLQVVELSGHPDLQIVVNASLQTVSSTVFRIRNSWQRLSWLITHKSRNDARTSGDHGYASWRCTLEPWPYYKVSISGVCTQCHGSWGELFMQSLFWMGTPLPTSIPTQTVDGNSFTIMQFYANGIGNTLTLRWLWYRNQSSPLIVSIHNFTTVRKDRRQCQGGGLLTLIHTSINFSWKSDSPETLVEPHLEELTITTTLWDTELSLPTSTYPWQTPAQEFTFIPWVIWWSRRTP